VGDLLFAATFATALGCGLVAGVFFAFSTFVMGALAGLPADQGIVAMQRINRTAVTPAFMAALLGTAAACAALVVAGALTWDEASAPWLLAGGALYLVGSVGLTIAYHVPRNDALAATDPRGPDAPGRWARYVTGWTAWNHVRAAAALAATAALIVALLVG
jgi:uncharacterized membrane protein